MKKMRYISMVMILCMAVALVLTGCGQKAQAPAKKAGPAVKDIILATTTSTRDSGLLDYLLPVFEKQSGYKVKVIAVGTGAALKMGEKGEADVLLVHAPDAEKKIMATGATVNRRLIMHNDFIFVGPKADPAKIKKMPVENALKAIAGAKAVFVSRGDDSGTHKKEKKLWISAKIKPEGAWYQQAGAGMAQTLKIADERHGYTLTDRATYLAQKKNLTLQILVEGDKKLLNIYHVMEVNSKKFSKVNAAGAKAFGDFLLSAQGQKMIAEHGKQKYGQPLFFADGGKTEQEFSAK